MTPIRRSWSLTVLVALVAVLAACTATDPRLEDEGAASDASPDRRAGSDADSSPDDRLPDVRSARRTSR